MASDSSSGNVTGSSGASSDSGGNGTSSSNQLTPGNTRQRLLPFLIDPVKTQISDGSEYPAPQLFSFRPHKVGEIPTGSINVMPSDHDEYNNDLGLKYLVSKYAKAKTSNGKNGEATRDLILENLPAIQIREYTQDTKLDLLWGLLKSGIEGFKAGSDAANGIAGKYNLSADQAEKFASAMASSLVDSSFWDQLAEQIGTVESYNPGIDTGMYESYIDVKTHLILDLVYALYFRMMGATTTNLYVLPYSGDDVINTDGTDGWGGANPWRVGDSAHSIFGKMFKFALGSNVKIVSEPIWGGSSGSGGSGINITLNLFNDTYDSAMMNFVFVNTIFPQNMFLQYGIFQQPPSVYDIQIEGSRRWFMCKGNFSCKYKGVMRNMNRDFVEDLFLKHGSMYLKDWMTPEGFISKRAVKIPDIYEITLNFSSLLPDNFNQFLFQYAMKNNISQTTKSREESWYNGTEAGVGAWIKTKFNDFRDRAMRDAKIDQSTADKMKKGMEIKDEVSNSKGGIIVVK